MEPPRHVAQNHEAADEKAEILRRPEAEGEPGQRGSQEHESDDADRSGDVGADGGDGKGRTRTTLPRHGITVDTGHHRGRLSGNPHQDRRRRPAVHGAVVNSRQENDGRRRVQAERRREEHADSGQGAHPRQDPDHRPDQAPDKGVKQIGRRKSRCKTHHEILESRFHQKPHPPLGKGTLSRESNSQNVPKEKQKVKSRASQILRRSMTPKRKPMTTSIVSR